METTDLAKAPSTLPNVGDSVAPPSLPQSDKAVEFLRTSGWLAALQRARDVAHESSNGPQPEHYAELTRKRWLETPRFYSACWALTGTKNNYWLFCSAASQLVTLADGPITTEEIELIKKAGGTAKAVRISESKTKRDMQAIWQEKFLALVTTCREDGDWYRLRPSQLAHDLDYPALADNRYGSRNRLGMLLTDPESGITQEELAKINQSRAREMDPANRMMPIALNALRCARRSGDCRFLALSWNSDYAYAAPYESFGGWDGFLISQCKATADEIEAKNRLMVHERSKNRTAPQRYSGLRAGIASDVAPYGEIVQALATVAAADPTWVSKILPTRLGLDDISTMKRVSELARATNTTAELDGIAKTLTKEFATYYSTRLAFSLRHDNGGISGELRSLLSLRFLGDGEDANLIREKISSIVATGGVAAGILMIRRAAAAKAYRGGGPVALSAKQHASEIIEQSQTLKALDDASQNRKFAVLRYSRCAQMFLEDIKQNSPFTYRTALFAQLIDIRTACEFGGKSALGGAMYSSLFRRPEDEGKTLIYAYACAEIAKGGDAAFAQELRLFLDAIANASGNMRTHRLILREALES